MSRWKMNKLGFLPPRREADWAGLPLCEQMGDKISLSASGNCTSSLKALSVGRRARLHTRKWSTSRFLGLRTSDNTTNWFSY